MTTRFTIFCDADNCKEFFAQGTANIVVKRAVMHGWVEWKLDDVQRYKHYCPKHSMTKPAPEYKLIDRHSRPIIRYYRRTNA